MGYTRDLNPLETFAIMYSLSRAQTLVFHLRLVYNIHARLVSLRASVAMSSLKVSNSTSRLRLKVKQTLRTIDLARAAGLSPQQVRNYEQWGVLPPAERSPHGYRLYEARHLRA